MDTPNDPLPVLPPRRKGGRPRAQLGAPSVKRKTDDEYSTNPLSVKRRRRLERQSAMEREVERAVTRDRVNKKNATDRYMKTLENRGLSQDEKEAAKAAFMAHWVEVNNTKPDSAIQLKISLGWYDDILPDDGDENWSDEQGDEDERLVAILCADEKMEGYEAPDLTEEEEHDRQGAIVKRSAQMVRVLLFHTLQNIWITSKQTFIDKIDAANRGAEDAHPRYFTKNEIGVWKVLALAGGQFSGDWYLLPGPSHMWPDHYAYERHGWVLPAMSSASRAMAKNAINILEGRSAPTKEFWALAHRFLAQNEPRVKGKGKA